MKTVKPIYAEMMLLFMTGIWGATFLFTKIGLENAPPFLYIVFRFLIALSLTLIFFGKSLRGINKKTFKSGMILGLLFSGGFILQTYGLEFTSITKSAFITGLTVVITPFVFKIINRKQKVKLWSKIGVIIASVGLWIFTDPNIDNLNLGDILTLFSTFFWALYINFMDIFTKGNDSFKETSQLVGLQFLFAIPLPLIAFLIFELDGLQVNFNNDLITSLAFNGILASFVLTFIHTTFQRYSTPVKAALIFSLEPVFAAFIAAVFISEILNAYEYFGASLLMLGVLISELGGLLFKDSRFSKK